MNRGDAYYHSKKYVPALYDYREAYKFEHSSPHPYAKVGAACFKLIEENTKKESPEKAKKWFALGMQHLKDGKNLIDRMLKRSDDTLENFPKAAYAPIARALVEADIRGLGLEEEERQIAELSSTLIKQMDKEDHPDPNISVEVNLEYGILLARCKKYEKAEKIFREIINQDPSVAGPAFNNFAVELRKNGEIQKAFEIYLELLDYEIPDRDIVIENLKTAGTSYTNLLRDEFKLEETIPIYKTILSFNPRGKEWILCDLAMVYLETQDQSQASSRLMEAVYINPRLMELEKFQQSYSDLGNLREEMIKKLTGMTDSQK